MKIISCDLCGNSNYRLLYATKDRSFPIEGSFQLVKCSDCGLFYLNPQPGLEELEHHYPKKEYYAYKDDKGPSNIEDNNKLVLLRTIRNWILDTLSRLFPILQNEYKKEIAYLGPINERTRVLDVGCGVGDGLLFYKARGASTYGVEINPEACELAIRKGHHVFCGQLFEARFEDEFFDVVRFNQSLEHMFSPKKILLEAKRILKHGGRVWVSLPNHDSIHARFSGKWFYAIESPRHLFGFTPLTMRRMLTQTGFEIEHIHTYSFPGGICYSLENWLNDHFKRKHHFYYGKIKIKWWYIALEPVLFFPRLITDMFNLGEILAVCGRKP